MSSYQITPYTFQQAKKIGVFVLPSHNVKFKIDVYSKNKQFITSCGATGYMDYGLYLENYTKEYADKRRALYKKRHQKDRSVVGSRGWFADKLLW